MKIYVLSNFRILAYLSILNELIKNRKKSNLVVLSRESINCIDYGEYLPKWNKKFKTYFLSLFFKVSIIETLNLPSENELDKTGLISSLMSITNDSGANSFKYPHLYNTLYKSAIGAYNVQIFLSQVKYNYELFLFNGRGASQFQISLFAFRNKIKTSYFEYGNSSSSGYKLYPYSPHSLLDIGRDLVNLFKINNNFSALNNQQKNLAIKIINEKLNNPFTKKLESTNLKFDVIVFLGSDHEYTGVSEEIVNVRLYGNFELCKYAFEKYGKQKSIAVRAHPNQIIDCSASRTNNLIREFCAKNEIVFFEPESKISSHSLIENSDIVVAEYSSISFDAIYLEKKVDILGDLDLKIILDEIPEKIKSLGPREISYYVAYVKSLESYLYFYKFNFILNFICKVFSKFENIISKQVKIF
jgi:hypothetical protein